MRSSSRPCSTAPASRPPTPAAAGDRRCGLGQDQHAGAPRGEPHPPRRRSAAHDAADLQPPRRAGDGAPRRRRAAAGAGAAGDAGAAQPALERHLPQHRRPAAARIRGPHRPGRIVHHPRPRRCRRPDGHGAARHRLVGDEESFSAQGHLPGHLLARAEHPRPAGARAAGRLSLVQPMGERAEETVRRLCRSQAAAERAGLRRPAAVLGRDDGRAPAGGGGRRALRPPAGGRIPGHQPPAVRDHPGAEAERRRRDGGGRRRAEHLFVPRRHGAKHPGLPAPVFATGAHRHAGSKLPQHASRSSMPAMP